MKIQQLSIFLENRSGRLANITNTLGDAGINIRALSLADTSDFGILRLVVNDTDLAMQVLKDKGFTVNLTEVMAVKVPDKPGELGKFLGMVEDSDLNVEYLYVFIDKNTESAVIIFRFDDTEKALTVLSSKGITMLESNELLGM